MEINEDAIPINPEVEDGRSFLGLDPLYLANEGKCVFILPKERAEEALEAMRKNEYGEKAAIIGGITAKMPGKVIMRAAIGGERILSMLEGEPLPRIC